MPFQFNRLALAHPDLTAPAIRGRVSTLSGVDAPRLQLLWSYYRNPTTPASDYTRTSRPYRQAQEYGLPARITGDVGSLGVARKEVVIENDIGWRVDAMVDFLFGQSVTITSAAPDESRRARIERLLRRVLSNNGGVAFLQRLALLGAVYGHVDVLVKYVPEAAADRTTRVDSDTQLLGQTGDDEPPVDDDRLPLGIRFEIVEPTRAVPLLSSVDPTVAIAYAQHFAMPRGSVGPQRDLAWIDALKKVMRRPDAAPDAARGDARDVSVLEVITPTQWQRYEDERLVAEGDNALGRVPLVHVQNAAVPFEYAGASDVEPLMPLQDELNTRISDRAYRISMQSAKMYLGKGIDDFADLPIGPGRMYSTENLTAEIVEFGGDSACPSEAAHIAELRVAIDKTSGVSPVAAGAIRDKIGNLTSAAALRITLTALLTRTERKRTTYGPAIAQLCELSLAWLDVAGAFRTTPDERRVEIQWPDPLPLRDAPANPAN